MLGGSKAWVQQSKSDAKQGCDKAGMQAHTLASTAQLDHMQLLHMLVEPQTLHAIEQALETRAWDHSLQATGWVSICELRVQKSAIIKLLQLPQDSCQRRRSVPHVRYTSFVLFDTPHMHPGTPVQASTACAGARVPQGRPCEVSCPLL